MPALQYKIKSRVKKEGGRGKIAAKT